jgi:prophage regulatory protein
METSQSTGGSPQKPGAIWRLNSVCQMTGLQKSTLYKLMSEGKFVPSVRLSARCVGWPSQAVIAWCEERVNAGKGAV